MIVYKFDFVGHFELNCKCSHQFKLLITSFQRNKHSLKK